MEIYTLLAARAQFPYSTYLLIFYTFYMQPYADVDVACNIQGMPVRLTSSWSAYVSK